jgi:hypothetical protein
MPSIVTLHVYSGRPNPTWLLDTGAEDKFTERLSAASKFTNTRPSGLIGGLGYRGFSVSRVADNAAIQSSVFVHEGILDQAAVAPNIADQTNMESWLLETAGSAVDDELREYVRSQISSPQTLSLDAFNAASAGCPANQAADAPAYNPGMWNVPTVQPFNNCYNYANNNATNTFAQPGRATGHGTSTMACSHVTPAAQSDGLKMVPNFSAPLKPGQGWYVALVVWPNRDYHWYRQDNVGCWSHKPGSTPVRNVDNANKQISDPQTCDRGNYTNFCTYMVTDRNVRIA